MFLSSKTEAKILAHNKNDANDANGDEEFKKYGR